MEAVSREDKEANYFAVCLLMPEKWVRAEVQKMGGDFDISDDTKIKALAKLFGMSIPMMTLRLGELYWGHKFPQ